MKRFFSLMLMAVAAICITACDDSGIDESVGVDTNNGNGAYLFASIVETRVAATDLGDNGISFAWEATDELNIVVDGATYVYKCEDAATGKFRCDETPNFVEGQMYDVTFGGADIPASQDNTDGSFGSDEHFLLRASFTHEAGVSPQLSFSGERPIVTVVCSGISPAEFTGEVIFDNGDKSYTAKGSFNGDLFTANIVIEPEAATAADAAKRDMLFRLMKVNDSAVSYYVSTPQAHSAGVRYLANLNTLKSYDGYYNCYTVAEIKDGMPGRLSDKTDALWFITDSKIGSSAFFNIDDYSGIVTYENGYSNISIVLPNASSIEESAFHSNNVIATIEAPLVKDVGSFSFGSCRRLTSLDLPAANSFGSSVFSGCGSLTELKLTSKEEISLGDTFDWFNNSGNCDLYLSNANYANVTNGNEWGGKTWKSITNVDIVYTTVAEIKAGDIDESKRSDATFVITDNDLGFMALRYAITKGNGYSNISVVCPNAASINSQAFWNCDAIVSLELPAVISISNNVIIGCDNLTELKITGDEVVCNKDAFYYLDSSNCDLYLSYANFVNVTNGDEWGGKTWKSITNVDIVYTTVAEIRANDIEMSKRSDVTLVITDEGIGNGDLQGAIIKANGYSNVSVVCPNAATIGNNAFYGCSEMVSLELSAVTNIGGSSIINYCDNLTELKITGGEVNCDQNAFFWFETSNCDLYLSSANYANVTNGNMWKNPRAWKSITKIVDIVYTTVAEINAGDIDMSKRSDATLVITDESIDFSVLEEAISSADGYSNVSVVCPNATTFGYDAFSNCDAMVSLELPKATSLDGYFLEDCVNLTELKITGEEVSYEPGWSSFDPSNCDLYLSSANYDNVMDGDYWGCATWKSITLVE